MRTMQIEQKNSLYETLKQPESKEHRKTSHQCFILYRSLLRTWIE